MPAVDILLLVTLPSAMAGVQVLEVVGVADREAAPVEPPVPPAEPPVEPPVVEETFDEQIARLTSRRGDLNQEKKSLAKTLKQVRKKKARVVKASRKLSDEDFAMMARLRRAQ